MRIVYSYYVLDIVHEWHLLTMRNAKTIAGEDGISIIGILTDEATMEKKARPVTPFMQRMALAGAIKYADVVVVQDTYSPLPNVERLRPDVLIESASHTDEIIEASERSMSRLGGMVMVLPYFIGQSTTNIKRKIRGGQDDRDNCCRGGVPHSRPGSAIEDEILLAGEPGTTP